MPRIYLHTLSLVWSSIQFSQQAVEKKVHQSYMTARFTVKGPKTLNLLHADHLWLHANE
jgi:hypothetical protein